MELVIEARPERVPQLQNLRYDIPPVSIINSMDRYEAPSRRGGVSAECRKMKTYLCSAFDGTPDTGATLPRDAV